MAQEKSEGLIALRKWLGLTQEGFARLFGVSFVTVNRWERDWHSPNGIYAELYDALGACKKKGVAPTRITAAGSPGAAFYRVFQVVHGKHGGKT